jgi:hypothetical protein
MVFFTQNKAKLCQKFDHNIAFWEKRHFFAENCQKSQKNHNIDPWSDCCEIRNSSSIEVEEDMVLPFCIHFDTNLNFVYTHVHISVSLYKNILYTIYGLHCNIQHYMKIYECNIRRCLVMITIFCDFCQYSAFFIFCVFLKKMLCKEAEIPTKKQFSSNFIEFTSALREVGP